MGAALPPRMAKAWTRSASCCGKSRRQKQPSRRRLCATCVPAGETAVFVMPIDKEAPKGRIKNLQVQAIRDLLDGESSCIVVKDAGFAKALGNMKSPPSLVVTDAQVFDKVARLTPAAVPMTAFSILLSRLKGDLVAQTRAALTVDELRPGDKILIAESCTHHPIEEDIGRVKIPRWLEKYVGGKLEFTHVKGRDFPQDLSPYKLVIHCGACMWNRQEMMSRIRECQRQHVPITNYGSGDCDGAGNSGAGACSRFPMPWRHTAKRGQKKWRGPRLSARRNQRRPKCSAGELNCDATAPNPRFSRGLRRNGLAHCASSTPGPTPCAGENVGDAVHLRGLIEISSHCERQCMYCGLRKANRNLERYRMTRDGDRAVRADGRPARLRNRRHAGRRR